MIENNYLKKARYLREKEKESEQTVPPTTQSLEKNLIGYLEKLVPRPKAERWTATKIWAQLQEAYLVVPNQWIYLPNRGKQNELYIEATALASPKHRVNTSTLTEVVRCRAKPRTPVPDRLFEQQDYREQFREYIIDREMLEIYTDELETILAEVSLQIREQTLVDRALNLSGRADHLLITEEGYVIREDKMSLEAWKDCSVPAIFQLHLYAYLVQSLFPDIPCRGLQVCVHVRGTETCQVYTFAPDWKWFIPQLAQALLQCWGVVEKPKCPTPCERKGRCSLIASFPTEITEETITREAMEEIVMTSAN